jgi:hypothetical protein
LYNRKEMDWVGGFEPTTSAMPTADRIKACQNPCIDPITITSIRAGNLKDSLHDKIRSLLKLCNHYPVSMI